MWSHPCWIWCWNSMFWICTKYFNKCKDIFRSKLILYGCLIKFGSMIYQDTYMHKCIYILSISIIWMWFEIKRKTLFVVFSEICCPTAPRIPLSIKTLELWRIFKEKIFLRWTVICLFSSCFSLLGAAFHRDHSDLLWFHVNWLWGGRTTKNRNY